MVGLWAPVSPATRLTDNGVVSAAMKDRRVIRIMMCIMRLDDWLNALDAFTTSASHSRRWQTNRVLHMPGLLYSTSRSIESIDLNSSPNLPASDSSRPHHAGSLQLLRARLCSPHAPPNAREPPRLSEGCFTLRPCEMTM